MNDPSSGQPKDPSRRRFLAGFGFVGGFLAFPLGLLAIASNGLLPTRANSDPPSWEQGLARIAFRASVARDAPRLINPLAATDGDLLAGLAIYRNNCAGCHGDSRQKSDWGSRSFYPRAPQFGFERPDKPDWQMFFIVKNGVRYSGMAAWDGLLTEEKIWQVVTFLGRLESLPASVAARWEKGVPP